MEFIGSRVSSVARVSAGGSSHYLRTLTESYLLFPLSELCIVYTMGQ